jgi:hypothetical protein
MLRDTQSVRDIILGGPQLSAPHPGARCIVLHRIFRANSLANSNAKHKCFHNICHQVMAKKSLDKDVESQGGEVQGCCARHNGLR